MSAIRLLVLPQPYEPQDTARILSGRNSPCLFSFLLSPVKQLKFRTGSFSGSSLKSMFTFRRSRCDYCQQYKYSPYLLGESVVSQAPESNDHILEI